MKAYLDIVKRVLETGERKENRTGVDALTIAGAMFEHDMAEGFPLLTTKLVPFKSVKTELEFFIKGLTDKSWLEERGCTIWSEWANPKRAPYGHTDEAKAHMRAERDLGPIYGFNWRHFGATYYGPDYTHASQGVDQLARLVETLKTNPADRRMIVTAWDPHPEVLARQALPPCHYGFQVTVINGKLNLLWNQRSVDVMLGLPFNIASYGLLLHLLAREAGLAEGKLVGFLADTHIYVNHVEGARTQLERAPMPCPTIVTERFTSIFDWTADATRVDEYNPMPKIEFLVAV